MLQRLSGNVQQKNAWAKKGEKSSPCGKTEEPSRGEEDAVKKIAFAIPGDADFN